MRKIIIVSITIVVLFTTLSFSQDDGITSETHKKNVGKILWAKERIKKDMQDRINYETVFDASDPLYGRVFLEKSLTRISESQPIECQDNIEFHLRLFINGEDKGRFHDGTWTDRRWTTGQISLNLTPGDEVDWVNVEVPEKWAAFVKGLRNGNHNIKIEFYGGKGTYGSEGSGYAKCQKKLAEGSFTLNKSGEMTSGKLKILPVAKKKDAALEAEMIKAIKARGWQNEAPIKVVIVEPDWRIVRNSFGVILRKEINTNVILKKTDGTCRLTDISFERPYQGGSNYGATIVYGVGMKDLPFDCDAVR